VERISDHAMNIAGYSHMIEEKRITFSDTALNEIRQMQKTCDHLLHLLLSPPEDIIAWHGKIAAMEQKIDDLTKAFRNCMFDRLQNGSCSDEGSVFFSEMLTDFERLGDHALNIAQAYTKMSATVA
jgi:phosphate:Na+ symporter